uniref:BTB domain-containing protein n=1 Tax=Panagrolaimus superbus TaxID=310955 RepID=A0A914Z9J7_9BILA
MNVFLAENVEYLLELGDKFQIQFVMDVCEKFLQTTTEIQCIQKLVWADTYAFSNLHHACIQSLDSLNAFKRLKSHEEYRKISDTTKAALYEKLIKLLP